MSRDLLSVRIGLTNGSGWGCLVQDAARTWTVSAHQGGGGSVAVHQSPRDEWTTFSSDRPMAEREKRVEGRVVVCSVTGPGAKPYGIEGPPWTFVYDGTITDMEALRAVLDPAWVVEGALGRPGDLVFVHLLKHLACVGPHVSSDLAMIRATKSMRLAQRLGTLAFVCSDGERLYAFALRRRLAVTRLGGTLVVGSPEFLPRGEAIESVPSGELVLFCRETLRHWSVRVAPDQ